MDELSPLFQEIEFHERWRGYDPDEVDAYVDRVAKVAAVAHGRLAELHERVESAEGRRNGSGEAEETLTRTLVLAQRTADAAIAEAREEAERTTTDAAASAQAILSAAEAEAQISLRNSQAEAAATIKDAEDRAALLLAEAETDRRQIVAEAESRAAEAATAERERLAAEVAELQQYRAFLADDIEILERHLTEERHQLTASLSALTDLLESPEAFRAGRVPQISGVEIDDALLEPRIDEPEPEPEPEPASEPEPTAAVPTIDLVAEEEAVESQPEAVLETEPVSADIDDDGGLADLDLDLDLDRQDDESGPEADGAPAHAEYATLPDFEMASSSLDLAPPSTKGPQLLVTAADLETTPVTHSSVSHSGGPATAPVPILQESPLFSDDADIADDSFLAQLREAMEGEPAPERDEEALSAFFDQEHEDEGRSWFGRRR
jgi:cell division initiation protein